MGDSDTSPQQLDNLTEPLQETVCENTKPSIDILKEAKPSENITLIKTGANSDILLQSASQSDSSKNETKNTVETVYESSTKIESPQEVVVEPPSEVDAAKVEVESKAEDSKSNPKLKNRSDIFSLNDTKNLPSTIFSVGGAPSKTIHKINRISSASAASTRASNETIDTQESTGSRQIRNPVTGQGVNSKDEYRNKPSRRRDGNPLLGVGYKDDDAISAQSGTPRIPPGGYSQGLW